MIFSPRVEITLLSNKFTVSKSAVGVTRSTGYLIVSPQNVNLVLFFLPFTSLKSQTILPLVTSLNLF